MLNLPDILAKDHLRIGSQHSHAQSAWRMRGIGPNPIGFRGRHAWTGNSYERQGASEGESNRDIMISDGKVKAFYGQVECVENVATRLCNRRDMKVSKRWIAALH